MAEFRRISAVERPLDVLREPMELSLVPLWPGFGGRWQSSFEWADRDLAKDGAEKESEFYDRYLAALCVLNGGEGPEKASSPSEDSARRIMLAALPCNFPGVDIADLAQRFKTCVDDAMDDHTPTERYRRRREILEAFLDEGYIPPCGPAELCGRGAKPFGNSPSKIRPIAATLARKILEEGLGSVTIQEWADRYRPGAAIGALLDGRSAYIPAKEMTKCIWALQEYVEGPWPTNFFDDADLRIYELYNCAGRAFRRACEDFFFSDPVAREAEQKRFDLRKRIVIKDRSEHHARQRREQDEALAARLEDPERMEEFRQGLIDDHRARLVSWGLPEPKSRPDQTTGDTQ